ncbi:hypothetical protein OAK61_00695 [Gammaproteobacteria bacterium]|nr:hypothetical protein [Gammaproteobacteria bacterium]
MKDSNLQKLNQILITILELDDNVSLDGLDSTNYKKWDSLAQVHLIAAIESEFQISVEVSEYEKFISYSAIKTLLEEFQL